MQRLFGFGRRLQLLPQQTRNPLDIEKEKTRAALRLLDQLQVQFDEYRRRAEKRQAEARIEGTMNACTQMLEAIDIMSRAFEMAPQELHNHAWFQGMFLATKQFTLSMKALGMVRLGMPHDASAIFDPHRHKAIGMQYREDLPDGTILQVVEHGYLFRYKEGEQMIERLIRPAQVIISTTTAPVEVEGELS